MLGIKMHDHGANGISFFRRNPERLHLEHGRSRKRTRSTHTGSIRPYRPGFESLDSRELLSTLAITSATVEPDGRTIQVVFTGTQPTAYSTPDWMPGSALGVQLTTNTGVPLEQIGNYVTTPAPSPTGTLVWTADYLVDNPASVITFGTKGVTLSAGGDLLQDSKGNITAPFSSFPAVNNSLVDANGFTTQSFQRGTGGVTIYVSSTYGSDSHTFAQAQNPATPYKTLTNALNEVYQNGMNGKGAAIELLDGDTFAGSGSIKTSGQDPQHPFLIGNYWYPYVAGAVDPGTRPVVSIDESSPTAPTSALGTYSGGGTPSTLNNIVIRNINFQATDWTGGAGSRFGLNFLVPGVNWTLDNDVFQNFGTNVNIQGVNGSIQNVTLLRCIDLDSRIDTSIVQQHSQGLYMDNVTGALISQSTFDDNGRVSADRTGRDIFSHNIYIQSTCGPSIVWGDSITNGGSHGIQMRSGGVMAYNYFEGNAIAGFIDGVGGTEYKNVVEDSQDISSTLLRGFGLGFTSNYGSSISDTAEFNITIDSGGSQPEGIFIDQSDTIGYTIQSTLVTHNTVISAGGLVFNAGPGFSPDNVSLVNTQNIYATASSKIYTAPFYTSMSWYSANNNDLSSTTSASAQTIMGNSNLSLTDWETATGTDSQSITTAPTFVNGGANLGSYALSLAIPGAFTSLTSTANAAAFIAMLRNRQGIQWPTSNNMESLYGYYAAAYTPTNLPVVGSTAYSYYGASSYVGPAPILTATPGFEQIALSWTPSQGATNYQIDCISSSGTVTLVKQTTATSYVVTGLNAGTTYSYQIVPLFGAITGTASNTTSATTDPASGGPPSTLSITVVAKKNNTLTWTPVSGAIQYYLYRANSSGVFSIYKELVGTSYVDTAVSAGNAYSYEIAGVFAGGVGTFSNKVTGQQ